MRKLLFLFLSVFLLCRLNLHAQETITIGAGTSTEYGPVSNYYGYERSLMLYRSSELIPGVIQSIAFQAPGSSTSDIPLKIYLKEVSFNQIPDVTSLIWNDLIADAILVYDETPVITSGSGWHTFPTTQNSFVYSGSGNLLVLTSCMKGNNGGSGTKWRYETVGEESTNIIYTTYKQDAYAFVNNISFREDYNTTSSTTKVLSGVNTTTSWVQRNIRWNTQFEIMPVNLTCPAISNLLASNITTTNADITWSAGDMETQWLVSYKKVSEVDWSPYTMVTSNSFSFTSDPLQPITRYQVRVRAYCGVGDTSYARIVSFTTMCPIYSVPFTEVFDTWGTGSNSRPPCWNIKAVAGSANISSTYSTSSPASLYITSASALGNYAIAATPEINVPNVNTLRVKLKAKQGGTTTNAYKLYIGVMSDPADETTFVKVDSITAANTSWNSYIINLNSYSGSGKYIAFRVNCNVASTSNYYYIDDLEIQQIPTCPDPGTPTVANITRTTVAVSATTTATDPAGWAIYYKKTADPDWNRVFTATLPYTLENLNHSTPYDIKVRTICTAGVDSSYVSEVVSFTTLCGTYATPLVESFDTWGTATGTRPRCWTATTSSTTPDAYISSSYSASSPASLYLYSGYSTGEYAIIATPELDVPSVNTLRAKFKARSSSNSSTYKLYIGVMTDPADNTTFTTVDSIVSNTNTSFNKYAVNLSNYTGTGKYVALKVASYAGSSRTFYVDDVLIEPIPTCPDPTDPVVTNINPRNATINSTTTYGGAPAAWAIYYKKTADTDWTRVTTPTMPYLLEGLNHTTSYQVKVRTICTAGADSSVVSDVTAFTTRESCPVPTGLILAHQADSLQQNQATLDWTSGYQENAWILQYKLNSSSTWNTQTITQKPYTLTGLERLSKYDVRLRSFCSEGDSSVNYSGTFSFTTLLNPITALPYALDFENGTESWVTINGTATANPNKWYLGTIPTSTGNCLYISNNGNSNKYTLTTTSVSHFLNDVVIPENGAKIAFDWRVGGEGTVDYLTVGWFNPTTGNIPVAGTLLNSSPTIKLNNPSNPVWKRDTITIPATDAGVKRLVFSWANNSSAGTQPPAAIDNITIDPITCGIPKDLAVGDMTYTTAVITWANPANASGAVLEYKLATDESWTVVNEALSPATLSNLVSGKKYNVRVKAHCGGEDYSFYTNTITFATPCEHAQTIPWSEEFEGNEIPDCWTQEYVTDEWNWETATGNGGSYPGTAHSGNYNLVFKRASYTKSVTKLVTPQFNLTGLASPTLEFWHQQRIWSNDQDTLKVYYKTSKTGEWIHLQTYSGSVTSWTKRTISLPNPTNDYYIAFEGISVYGYGVVIDDVSIYNIPCSTPAGLAVAAADVTNSEAKATWTVSATTRYNFEYKESSSSDWTVIADTTSPVILTGLLPNTTYNVRIKADCGSGDFSDYSSTVSFTTACNSIDVPWMEQFTTFPVSCWTRFTGLLRTTSTLSPTTAGWSSATISGEPMTYLNIYGDSRMHWLVTPSFNLGDGTTLYHLSFDLMGSASSSNITNPPSGTRTDDKLAVVISTDGGATWSNTNTLRLWDNAGSSYVFNNITNVKETITIPLSGYSGTVKIAFYGESTVSGDNNYYFIDNVAVSTCAARVTNISVPTVTASTAEVNWAISGDAASSILEYKASTATDWIVVDNAVSPATLSGLSPATNYEIRIKASCGQDDHGFYTPGTFTTPASCVVPTDLDIPTADIDTRTAQVTWTNPGNAQSAVLEYKRSTATDWTAVSDAVSPAMLTGLQPNTTYQVRVKAFCGGDDYSEYTSTKTFTTLISCEAPTALAVPSYTTATAQVSWTNPENVQSAVLEYKISTATDWTAVPDAVSPATLTGLQSNTTYNVRVKASCGEDDYSEYTSTVTFTTTCFPATTPWFDGLEEYTHAATSIPCYSQEAESGTGFWTINQTNTDYNRTPRTGTRNITLRYGNTNWLFRELHLEAGTTYTFTLYARQDGVTSSNASITVKYGTTATAAGMTENIIAQTGISNGSYQKLTGNFTVPATGNYFIGIKGAINNSPWYISVDDISVTACNAVADLAVGNILSREAQVTWTTAPGTTTVLEYKLATATDWTVVTNAVSPYTLSSLTPDAAYEVRIQSDCGNGNISLYSTKSFTTLIACPVPTALDIPAAGITTTSAQVTWTPSIVASTSVLEYKAVTSTDWTVVDNAVSPATIPGLSPATLYNVRVKADCAIEGISTYTAVKTFITACDAAGTIPWNEGFEDYAHAQTLLPCISQVSETGDSVWIVNQTNTDYNRTPRTGNNNITLRYGNTDWLFKQLHLEGGVAYNFTLYARQNSSTTTYANITVKYGTVATVAGMTSTIIPETGLTNGDYQQLTGYFVAPTTGDYYVGIKGYLSSSPYYISMDDISVTVAPCPVTPIAFDVPGNTIVGSTANVVWNSVSGTSYVIEYKLSTATDWTVITENVTSPYTLTGLSEGNTYNVRMKSYCVEDEYSDYTTTKTFLLPISPATLPYVYGFEDDTENAKWTSVYDGTKDRWVIGDKTNNGGTKAMYIANSSGEYTYSSTYNYPNIWRDITFPAGTEFEISFDWKCKGEGGASDNYDNMKVYLLDANTSVTAAECATAKKIGLSWYSNSSDWNTATISLGSAYANTTKRLVFGWRADVSGSYPPPAAVDNLSIKAITCPVPTNVMIDAEMLSATTALVLWDLPAEAQDAILEYKLSTDTEWEEIWGAGGGYELTGLLSNETYQVRVRAYCGGDDYSKYSEVKTFKTVCGPVTLPWIETFTETTFPPVCWSRYSGLLGDVSVLTSTTGGWSASNIDGNREATLSIGGTTTKNWLVTPEMNLGDGNTDYILTFKLAGSTSASDLTTPPSGDRADDKLAVIISMDAGETWSNSYVLREWDNQGSQYIFDDITNIFQEVTIPLTGFTGNVKFAFYGESTVGNATNYYHIDDVAVSSCPVPTALEVLEPTITSSSATVTWAPADGSASSILEYKLTSATEWTVFADVTPPYTLTDLMMGATYSVRVKAFCGGNNFGNYVEPITFVAGCQAVTLPWEETFEGDFLPGCWTRFSGNLAASSTLTSTTGGWTSATVDGDKVARLNITGTTTKYWLVTPEINLGDGSTVYNLSFDVMGSNASTGTTVPSGDRADDKFAVVISTDGGTTWSNVNILRLWDNQSARYSFNDITNNWKNIRIPLHQYSGTVKIAFYGESTVSGGSNYYFVNNVTVDELTPYSIALNAVDPIASSCDLGNKPVTIHVENLGKEPITSFTAKYKIGIAGTFTSETVTPETPITTSEHYSYTFNTNANFPEGNDTLITIVELSGDDDLLDNEASTTLRRYPAGTIPYYQDFNAYGTEGFLENWSNWDLNSDSKKFDITYSTLPDYYAFYSYNDLMDANDWLISSCIDIPEGTYRVSYDYAVAHPYFAENMEVYLGTSNTVEAMTIPVGNHQGFYNADFKTQRTPVILEGGVYYVGVHASSLKGGMGIKFDNLKIDPVHLITASRTGAGTITPMGDSIVEPGASVQYTITPHADAEILDVLVDGVSQGLITSYTFSNVSANHTIEAVFSAVIYNIVSTAGTGGSISPSGTTPVTSGESQAYTITPDEGYEILDVLVDGVSVGTLGTYTFANVSSAHTIDATFIAVHTISATATTGGTLSPSGDVTVRDGGSKTFTITPSTGHYVAGITVNGVEKPITNSYTFTNVTGDSTIHVVFAINTYTVTATAGEHGTISPANAVTVNYGQNQTFTFTPETGYHVETVTVNGSPRTVTGNSYTMNAITGDSTIHVTFAINVYTITATAGMNGSIDPQGATSVQHGQNQTFTITPNGGYQIQSIMVDGVSVEIANPYTFTNVTGNHTIAVSFSPQIHTISETHTAGGSVSPSGSVSVQHGNNQQFTFTPNTGYHVESVTVNGVNVGAPSSYTFQNVTGDSTIHVAFVINTYTITSSVIGSNGTITPDGETSVQHGENVVYTITPATGYMIDRLLVDGVETEPTAENEYTYTAVSADHTIEVSFIRYYTITASSADISKGRIDPSGEVKVKEGGDQTFGITTEVGFDVADVRVDGVSVGAVNEYTFTNVMEDHTITVDFAVGIKEPAITSIKVYSSEHNVYIANNGTKAIKSVEIFDNYGKLVYKGSVVNNPEIIPMITSTGNYVVRIVTEDQIGVYKVFIQQR